MWVARGKADASFESRGVTRRRLLSLTVAVVAVVTSPCRSMLAQNENAMLVVVARDRVTMHVLPKAVLGLLGTSQTCVTDSQGTCTLSAKVGLPATVEARRLGYRPRREIVDSPSGRTVILLEPLPEVLAVQSVLGRLDVGERLVGFERRRALNNGGSFLGPDDIEHTHPLAPTDLLRRIASIRIADSAGIRLPAAMRKGKGFLDPCYMRVVVDGLPKEWGFPVDVISVQELYGIEVYTGASIPSEFASMRRDNTCGVVLLWTK